MNDHPPVSESGWSGNGTGRGIAFGWPYFVSVSLGQTRVGGRDSGDGTGRGHGGGRRGRDDGGYVHPLLRIEGLHLCYLLVNKIGGLSQVGDVPGSDKIVYKHAAWKRRMLFGGPPLICKKCSLLEKNTSFLPLKSRKKKARLTRDGTNLFITCRIVPSSNPCRTWPSKSMTRRRICSGVRAAAVEVIVVCVVQVVMKECRKWSPGKSVFSTCDVGLCQSVLFPNPSYQ